jgi:hypothetical protein
MVANGIDERCTQALLPLFMAERQRRLAGPGQFVGEAEKAPWCMESCRPYSQGRTRRQRPDPLVQGVRLRHMAPEIESDMAGGLGGGIDIGAFQ